MGTIAPSFRMGSMHHGATQEQMRHMRRASHLKLGFHSRPRRIQIVGKGSQFPHEGILVFLPTEYLLNRLGGIPVPSRKGAELTSAIVSRFNGARYMNLAVTPEGTRSRNDKWRKGFLYIAYGAKVPLQLGVIDYRSKKIIIKEEYLPTGDIETDMRFVSRFYCDYADAALYPDKFAVSDLNQP